MVLAAWVVWAVMVSVAAGRTWGTGPFGFLAVASAAVPILFVASWPVAVLALVDGQSFLALAFTLLAACHLAWLLPRRGRHQTENFKEGDHLSLTLFSANLSHVNPDVSFVASEIAASGADVVIALELTPSHLTDLLSTGVLDAHPWKMVLPDGDGAFGIGMWSKLPIADLEAWDLQGIPQIRGDLQLDDARVIRILGVHAPAPWPGSARRWVDGLDELRTSIRFDDRPVLVAGDLNATWDHRPFRDLIDTGLRDAAIEVGHGWARTWPNHWAVFGPLIRIDHVLVAGDVIVNGYRLGRGRGE